MAYNIEEKTKNFIDVLKNVNTDIRAKNFSPFYYIYGEEYFFISKLESNIRKSFVDNVKLNTKIYDEDNFDIDEAIKYITNMPFMNDKKLIIFKDIKIFKKKQKKEEKKDDIVTNDKKQKTIEEQLIEALVKSKESNIVIVIMHEYEKKYEKDYGKDNIFIDFFTKNGIVINSQKLDENELTKYVVSWFKKENIEIDKVLAMHLIKNAGKSLSNLYCECEKIINYISGKNKVEKEDIDAIVSINIEENVFKLVDYINSNRKNEALRLYGDLISENSSPFSIFSILTTNYKDMLIVKSMVERSKSLKEIADITEFPEWKVRNIMNACKSITKDDIAKKLRKVTRLHTEYMHSDITENLMLEMLFY